MVVMLVVTVRLTLLLLVVATVWVLITQATIQPQTKVLRLFFLHPPRAASVAAPAKGFAYDPASRTFVGSGTDAIYEGGGQYGKTQAEKDAEAAAAVVAEPIYYAQGGGISTLGSYSDGGRLLKGPGDGMSDNIPAKIGAKQPARLADGEFVVPADVVSHLGNGSTDAGAKQLYKMMDRIRAARTGRKAQGKQVNPNKFMPA
jgi:hypothetical protein